MELFTLGAGRGYTERDVREQARALTGFRNDWRQGIGPYRFRFDRERADVGMKRVFGRRGRFDWRDACELCLRHKSHPAFFVQKLWGYFIPTPPPKATQKALERRYVKGRYAVRPVVEAILKHPHLYEGPRMVKPPIVYTAGLLRAAGKGVDTEAWTWLCANAGQQLFFPPNVSGWNDERWLDTATYLARWDIAGRVTRNATLDPGKVQAPSTPTSCSSGRSTSGAIRRSQRVPVVCSGVHQPGPRHRRHLELEEEELPSPDRELTSPPDRRLPGLPDL